MKCRACGAEIYNKNFITGRDRMTKLGGEFKYYICDVCDSISIDNIPLDLDKRYDKNYYSYQWKEGDSVNLNKKSRAEDIIEICGLDENSAVLEWGAGTAEGVQAFYEKGVGVDGELHKLRAYEPYADNYETVKGIKVQNYIPTDIKFDLLMTIHSMEHTENMIDTMGQMLDCVKQGGYIYIDLPVWDAFLPAYYGADSVNMDAPRHLFIPTRKAMEMLFERYKLETINSVNNQSFFGLWYSQGYKIGKTYNEIYKKLIKSPPKEKEIKMYNAVCEYFNNLDIADGMVYVIRKK